MEHYMEECKKVCSWFRDLGEDKEEIWKKLWSEELDSEKYKVLSNLKREREKGLEKENWWRENYRGNWHGVVYCK